MPRDPGHRAPSKRMKGLFKKTLMDKSVKIVLTIVGIVILLGLLTIVGGGAYLWYRFVPRESKALYQGYRLMGEKKYDEANAVFDQILNKNPDYMPAISGKAEVFKQQEKYDDAVALYDEVLKRRPDDISALNGKADILTLQGKNDEAVSVYDRVTALNPKSCSAWNAKGEILLKAGRPEEALGAFDEGLKFVDEMT